MPGPPEEVPASELFLKLQETRPSEVVNFPRKTSDGKPIGTTRIQVLRSEDHDQARLLALKAVRDKHKLTKEDLETPLGAALVGDATARELLAMACLTEKSHGGEAEGKPFYPRVFKDADAIGKTCSADEVACLFQCYLLVQAKWGPFERSVQTDEDLSKWIKRLVEGAREFPLQHLSSAHWAETAYFLAERAYLLSAILESLWPSLPDSLKSRLGRYSLGTGYFGRRAGSSPPDGSETSASSEALRLPDVQVTIEDAAAMAARMKALEEGALAIVDEAEANRGD